MNGLLWENIAPLIGIPPSFSSALVRSVVWDGLKLLILGSVIETARRIFIWVVDRFRIRWSTTAEFEAGDVTQEWIINYLIQERVWRTPRNIFVKTRNNKRKWKLQTRTKNDQVDFIPEYGFMQFFRWRGYLFEVSSQQDRLRHLSRYPRGHEARHLESHIHSNSISLTIFTLDRSVLYAFVEECRLKYVDAMKSEVTVYTADVGRDAYRRGGIGWNDVKMIHRRPLDSLLLDENVIGSLLKDAREFLDVEDWYIRAGIPHRRGYLLHGPPGTGKTSTIHTVAGELGLDIYVLPLSTKSLDDASLAHLVSRLPPRGVLVLEDIDCAFPSRVDGAEREPTAQQWNPSVPKSSQVTLSGLLNILDGVGSEEGKIFFATTNHIDRLDAALVRPGRIDRKIEYRLASPQQARGLFLRFFPEAMFSTLLETPNGHVDAKEQDVQQLADKFAMAIPSHEFSMAELQGYFLNNKGDPLKALVGIQGWVENARQEKQDKEASERLQNEQNLLAQVRARFAYDEAVAGVPTAIPTGVNVEPIPLSNSAASTNTVNENGGDQTHASDNTQAPRPQDSIENMPDAECETTSHM